MNEEKQIILRMLSEEKITIEEAEALLDAVQEAEEEAAQRESSTEDYAEENSTTDDDAHKTSSSEEGDSSANDWFDEGFQSFQDFGKRLSDGVSGILKDLDIDKIKEDVKGVVDSVKEELKNADFDGDISSVMSRAFGKSRANDEKELTIQPEGIDVLQIDDSWGSINVVGGDSETILVKAEVSAWGKDEEEALEIAQNVKINTLTEGSVLKISPLLNMAGEKRRFKVDFHVQGPRRLSVRLNTKSGDIEAATIDGKADITTFSGDAKASDIGSNLKIGTKSGDIRCDRIDGSASLSALSGDITAGSVQGAVACSAKSGDFSLHGGNGAVTANLLSGDISVQERLGDIEAKTKSGDVTLNGVNGSIICKTMSGDIRCNAEILGNAETSSMSGDVKISAAALSSQTISCKSMGGDVKLIVPVGVGLEVDAETRAGSVSTDFAAEGIVIDSNKKKMTGTVNGGGTKVTISALGGSVNLSKA